LFDCFQTRCPYNGPTCDVNGDPHYLTFDGYYHHYQGACEYILAKSCNNDDFIISADNIQAPGSRVSFASFVRIRVPAENLEILINRGSYARISISIHGNPVNNPCPSNGQSVYKSDNVEIFCRGGYPYVCLIQGVRIYYDGFYHVKITVPTSLRGQLCGLCDTYNGDRNDDLTTRNGTVIPLSSIRGLVEITSTIVNFGDSWILPNPSIPSCAAASIGKRNAPGITGCSTDPGVISEGQTRCSVLEQAPFNICNDVVNVT